MHYVGETMTADMGMQIFCMTVPLGGQRRNCGCGRPERGGKSTAMKAVFDVVLRSGRVMMDGEDITALKPRNGC